MPALNPATIPTPAFEEALNAGEFDDLEPTRREESYLAATTVLGYLAEDLPWVVSEMVHDVHGVAALRVGVRVALGDSVLHLTEECRAVDLTVDPDASGVEQARACREGVLGVAGRLRERVAGLGLVLGASGMGFEEG